MRIIIAGCPKCNTILRPLDLDYERFGLVEAICPRCDRRYEIREFTLGHFTAMAIKESRPS
jgi:ssDNA-binding Zn-finger/Zn-ribbon topoisomerase 1